tara:strand:- start:2033 stop:2257 length:225 start_codon:yes stop_codon:yes gene_type:complete
MTGKTKKTTFHGCKAEVINMARGSKNAYGEFVYYGKVFFLEGSLKGTTYDGGVYSFRKSDGAAAEQLINSLTAK